MNDCLPEGVESVEYDDETETHQAAFNSDAIAPSRAVVRILSEISDEQPTEFEPLYSVIDPEALDILCATHPLDSQEGDCIVRFTYLGYQITVKNYGFIEVQPLSVAKE